MKSADEAHLLSVLDAIGEDASRSQRQVSGVTGVNLAKVNYLLRELIARGLVTMHNVSASKHRLRYLYHLTPDGMAERSRLTYRFIKRTLDQYEKVEQRVHGRLVELRAAGATAVAVLGADRPGVILAAVANRVEGMRVVAVYDDERCGQRIEGRAVRATSSARHDAFDRLVTFARRDQAPADVAGTLGVPVAKVVVL